MNMEIINQETTDTISVTTINSNHGFPGANIWTVIGNPDSPDFVIDPEGEIHTMEWGGPGIYGRHSPEALAVYNRALEEAVN